MTKPQIERQEGERERWKELCILRCRKCNLRTCHPNYCNLLQKHYICSSLSFKLSFAFYYTFSLSLSLPPPPWNWIPKEIAHNCGCSNGIILLKITESFLLKTFTQTMTAFLFRRLLSKTLSNNWDKTLLAISVGKLVTLSMSHFRVFFFHRVRQFLLSYPIQGFCVTCNSKNKERSFGWEPWSSGYGRRLMFRRSWVRIPAAYTGWSWHFFTLICCKKFYCVFEKTEN